LRPVDDLNPDPQLAALEARVLNEANALDIGPMGFGGKLTVGGCKVGARNRLPASFFVSVAYMCWAYRRRGVVLGGEGEVVEWLYQAPGEFDQDYSQSGPELIELGAGGKEAVRLTTPLREEDVRKLKAGDMVLLSGKVFTGRDEVHKYLHKGGDLPVLHGGVIYHCGPVVLEETVQGTEFQVSSSAGRPGVGGPELLRYKVVAAGPTTSIREEPYQAHVIERFGIKAVIGKGGMGAKTLEACKKHGCVYLHAIGGAAQIYAQCVRQVHNVHPKHLGSPQGGWGEDGEDLPAAGAVERDGPLPAPA